MFAVSPAGNQTRLQRNRNASTASAGTDVVLPPNHRWEGKGGEGRSRRPRHERCCSVETGWHTARGTGHSNPAPGRCQHDGRNERSGGRLKTAGAGKAWWEKRVGGCWLLVGGLAGAQQKAVGERSVASPTVSEPRANPHLPETFHTRAHAREAHTRNFGSSGHRTR